MGVFLAHVARYGIVSSVSEVMDGISSGVSVCVGLEFLTGARGDVASGLFVAFKVRGAGDRKPRV